MVRGCSIARFMEILGKPQGKKIATVLLGIIVLGLAWINIETHRKKPDFEAFVSIVNSSPEDYDKLQDLVFERMSSQKEGVISSVERISKARVDEMFGEKNYIDLYPARSKNDIVKICKVWTFKNMGLFGGSASTEHLVFFSEDERVVGFLLNTNL